MSSSQELNKAYLGILPVFVTLGMQEYSRKHYITFARVLPQKWNCTFGSIPKLTKMDLYHFESHYLIVSICSSQEVVTVRKSAKCPDDVQGVFEIILDHSKRVVWRQFWSNVVDPNLRCELLPKNYCQAQCYCCPNPIA